MLGLTLDVQVVMSGSGKGDPVHRSECRKLMTEMLAHPECELVVDDGRLLLTTYQECTKDSFGAWWLRQMLNRNKVRFVKRCVVGRSTRAELGKFKGEDLDRVARSAASGDGLVVAHEPHFTNAKTQKVLHKRLGVKILSAEEAVALLDETPKQPTPSNDHGL